VDASAIDVLVSFEDVTGGLSKELESIKFVSCSVLGGVGHDVVLTTHCGDDGKGVPRGARDDTT
jgi:hypothetical protein